MRIPAPLINLITCHSAGIESRQIHVRPVPALGEAVDSQALGYSSARKRETSRQHHYASGGRRLIEGSASIEKHLDRRYILRAERISVYGKVEWDCDY